MVINCNCWMSPRVYVSCNSRYMPDRSRQYIIKVKILIYIRIAEVRITIGRHFRFFFSFIMSGSLLHSSFQCRHATLLPIRGGALRDHTKNGCVTDYMFGSIECNS